MHGIEIEPSNEPSKALHQFRLPPAFFPCFLFPLLPHRCHPRTLCCCASFFWASNSRYLRPRLLVDRKLRGACWLRPSRIARFPSRLWPSPLPATARLRSASYLLEDHSSGKYMLATWCTIRPTERRSVADTGARHSSSESPSAKAAKTAAPSSMRSANNAARRPAELLIFAVAVVCDDIFHFPSAWIVGKNLARAEICEAIAKVLLSLAKGSAVVTFGTLRENTSFSPMIFSGRSTESSKSGVI